MNDYQKILDDRLEAKAVAETQEKILRTVAQIQREVIQHTKPRRQLFFTLKADDIGERSMKANTIHSIMRLDSEVIDLHKELRKELL